MKNKYDNRVQIQLALEIEKEIEKDKKERKLNIYLKEIPIKNFFKSFINDKKEVFYNDNKEFIEIESLKTFKDSLKQFKGNEREEMRIDFIDELEEKIIPRRIRTKKIKY